MQHGNIAPLILAVTPLLFYKYYFCDSTYDIFQIHFVVSSVSSNLSLVVWCEFVVCAAVHCVESSRPRWKTETFSSLRTMFAVLGPTLVHRNNMTMIRSGCQKFVLPISLLQYPFSRNLSHQFSWSHLQLHHLHLHLHLHIQQLQQLLKQHPKLLQQLQQIQVGPDYR